MAAGDVNSREINNGGSLSMITGTLEAANGTAVALLSTKSYILFAVVQNGDDEEGAGCSVVCNVCFAGLGVDVNVVDTIRNEKKNRSSLRNQCKLKLNAPKMNAGVSAIGHDKTRHQTNN